MPGLFIFHAHIFVLHRYLTSADNTSVLMLIQFDLLSLCTITASTNTAATATATTEERSRFVSAYIYRLDDLSVTQSPASEH